MTLEGDVARFRHLSRINIRIGMRKEWDQDKNQNQDQDLGRIKIRIRIRKEWDQDQD